MKKLPGFVWEDGERERAGKQGAPGGESSLAKAGRAPQHPAVGRDTRMGHQHGTGRDAGMGQDRMGRRDGTPGRDAGADNASRPPAIKPSPWPAAAGGCLLQRWVWRDASPKEIVPAPSCSRWPGTRLTPNVTACDRTPLPVPKWNLSRTGPPTDNRHKPRTLEAAPAAVTPTLWTRTRYFHTCHQQNRPIKTKSLRHASAARPATPARVCQTASAQPLTPPQKMTATPGGSVLTQGQGWVQKLKVMVGMRSPHCDLTPGQAQGWNMAQPRSTFYFFSFSRLQKKTENMGTGETIKHSCNKISHFTLFSAPLLQLFFLSFAGPNTPETQLWRTIPSLAKHYHIYGFRYSTSSLLQTLKQFCLPAFIFTYPY